MMTLTDHNRIMLRAALGLAAVVAMTAGAAPTQEETDEWSHHYRNWSYYPDWAVKPSCLDPLTCPNGERSLFPHADAHQGTNTKDRFKAKFTDIAEVWKVPGATNFSMSYTFYDGVGYQTAIATSSDLLQWDQSPGIAFSPRENRSPTSWNATPGDFDYGGAAFVGPLLTDYNISAARTLLKVNGAYWITYFAQPTRFGIEPPPGATGLARSADGVHWERGIQVPMMDTFRARGARSWEQTQIYAPYLLVENGTVYDYYNANSGTSEQTGLATIPLAAFPGVDAVRTPVSKWNRFTGNPIVANGATCVHQAADPKVYYDSRLDDGKGAWVMFFFGTDPDINGGRASINVAFSRDMFTWTKATAPLYEAGGHPAGLDKCECHKVWLTGNGVDDTIYMYYTGDGCEKGRGILLLTSKPVV